jgi:hypothetical protein
MTFLDDCFANSELTTLLNKHGTQAMATARHGHESRNEGVREKV